MSKLKILRNEFFDLAGLVGYSFPNFYLEGSPVVFLTIKALKRSIPQLFDLGYSLLDISQITVLVLARRDIASDKMDLVKRLVLVEPPSMPKKGLNFRLCNWYVDGISPFPHVTVGTHGVYHEIVTLMEGINFCFECMQNAMCTPERALVFFREISGLDIPLDEDDYNSRFNKLSVREKMRFNQARVRNEIHGILKREGYKLPNLEFPMDD